ncbi:hypothetical protein KY284_035500 [Solanum tuberosum]|nr:hypothetical protein KY284_035500 [Solanum tuberosum]
MAPSARPSTSALLLSLARKFLAFSYKKNKNLQMNLSMSLSQLILPVVKDFSLDLLTTLVQQRINSNNAFSNSMTIDDHQIALFVKFVRNLVMWQKIAIIGTMISTLLLIRLTLKRIFLPPPRLS